MKHLAAEYMTVEDLVRLFAEGDIAIPEIQREFVWDDDQVKELIHSIDEGFPCGAIILWEPRNADKKLFRDLIKQELLEKFPGHTPRYFLIDGQQRLTSLASVLMKRDDFQQMLSDFDPDDLPSKLYGNLKRFPWEIGAADGGGSSKPHLVLLNDLFDLAQPRGDVLATLNPNQREAVHKYVQRIRTYQFPVQTIQERDYETVGEIFARVNSQGTTLEGAEIHLARIVPHWRGIAGQLKDFRNELRQRNYDLELTFLMRSITAVECRVGKIEKLADKIRQKDNAGKKFVSKPHLDKTWNKVKKATNKVINILESDLRLDKIKFVPSENVLVPLVYYVVNEKSATLSRKDILRFFVYAQLSGYYSKSTETMLSRSLKIFRYPGVTIREGLSELVKNVKEEARQEYRALKIKPKDVVGSPTKNALVLLMYILMRQQGATDLGDSRINIGEITPKETQLHHIFPFNYMMADKSAQKFKEEYGLGEFRSMVNDIANRTFISQSINVKISDQEPWDYLPNYTTKAVRRAHFIPEDKELWHANRYVDFLKARRSLLAQAMNKLLKSIG